MGSFPAEKTIERQEILEKQNYLTKNVFWTKYNGYSNSIAVKETERKTVWKKQARELHQTRRTEE